MVKIIETESRKVVERGWRSGEMGVIVNRVYNFNLEDEKSFGVGRW